MERTEILKKYWQSILEQRIGGNPPAWVLNKKQLHEKRGSNVPRVRGEGRIFNSSPIDGGKVRVNYDLTVTFFVKQGHSFYHEEENRKHTALIQKGEVIHDEPIVQEYQPADLPVIEVKGLENMREARFGYDRRAAVRYAERWWNDYNPAYTELTVDCTNFVSQCLHAGGAPMRGAPDKGSGWWYQNGSWSFSWAVAHSLRWYLSGSAQGLKGTEVERPDDLSPGDVICYDFQGDGRWDHNTIVVSKDTEGMPLVNAHTDNSRHRYWSYEDSMAWTENCQYKFFRIGE
ncbi:amidase domain-containing protein [Sediminibacillus massiliensis]|uniref:amidase domain-containing protein n=1 Tax=Sediminibacillus massiliensis TaxID=1926277 RepID=UPI00098835F0|nr:amidase domain-containing protein [Sediminibacillus massiliensis]